MDFRLVSKTHVLRSVVDFAQFCFPCNITLFYQPLFISFSITCCNVLIGPRSGVADLSFENQMLMPLILKIIL